MHVMIDRKGERMMVESISFLGVRLALAGYLKIRSGPLQEIKAVLVVLERGGEGAPKVAADIGSETAQTGLGVIIEFFVLAVFLKILPSGMQLNGIMKECKGKHVTRGGIETAHWILLTKREENLFVNRLSGQLAEVMCRDSLGIRDRIQKVCLRS